MNKLFITYETTLILPIFRLVCQAEMDNLALQVKWDLQVRLVKTESLALKVHLVLQWSKSKARKETKVLLDHKVHQVIKDQMAKMEPLAKVVALELLAVKDHLESKGIKVLLLIFPSAKTQILQNVKFVSGQIGPPGEKGGPGPDAQYCPVRPSGTSYTAILQLRFTF